MEVISRDVSEIKVLGSHRDERGAPGGSTCSVSLAHCFITINLVSHKTKVFKSTAKCWNISYQTKTSTTKKILIKHLNSSMRNQHFLKTVILKLQKSFRKLNLNYSRPKCFTSNGKMLEVRLVIHNHRKNKFVSKQHIGINVY